ncbi:MAG TPA: Uma2 family endonuclease [Thermoanaerobaculia bacterium]|jgi:Uma2 family endonuclease|nr:Uma2 family endonuclease [Thermoanaerobaculia bacterium]
MRYTSGMAREHLITFEEGLVIPPDASTFSGFERWAASAAFPETGRIDFLAGDVEVEMSPEDLHTHGIVKGAIHAALHTLFAELELGEVFTDSTRVTSSAAGLSTEPDVVAVFWSSLREGRAHYLSSGSDPDRLTKIEGSPDLIVEVVSDSSVTKDYRTLPPLYARAGIPELWIADARGNGPLLRAFTLDAGSYREIPSDAEGWFRSSRLGFFFRLSRKLTPLSTWRYLLEHREGPACAE